MIGKIRVFNEYGNRKRFMCSCRQFSSNLYNARLAYQMTDKKELHCIHIDAVNDYIELHKDAVPQMPKGFD